MNSMNLQHSQERPQGFLGQVTTHICNYTTNKQTNSHVTMVTIRCTHFLYCMHTHVHTTVCHMCAHLTQPPIHIKTTMPHHNVITWQREQPRCVALPAAGVCVHNTSNTCCALPGVAVHVHTNAPCPCSSYTSLADSHKMLGLSTHNKFSLSPVCLLLSRY